MLGSAYQSSKSNNSQRRRIEISNTSEIDNIIKESKRKTHMTFLANKYFNKISDEVCKAIYKNKNSINFYYNYYDFVNDGLGKPHGFLNEFMYNMCYEYSEYVSKDPSGNIITFKSIFGPHFRWELRGKNMMIISW